MLVHDLVECDQHRRLRDAPGVVVGDDGDDALDGPRGGWAPGKPPPTPGPSPCGWLFRDWPAPLGPGARPIPRRAAAGVGSPGPPRPVALRISLYIVQCSITCWSSCRKPCWGRATPGGGGRHAGAAKGKEPRGRLATRGGDSDVSPITHSKKSNFFLILCPVGGGQSRSFCLQQAGLVDWN